MCGVRQEKRLGEGVTHRLVAVGGLAGRHGAADCGRVCGETGASPRSPLCTMCRLQGGGRWSETQTQVAVCVP